MKEWLESTPVHDFMINVPWAFPASETLHFMGLTLLIGSLLVVDMRALGFFRAISHVQAHKLVPVAIFGFAINLITGLAFLAADPNRYFGNFGLRFKLILIVLAGINAILFEVLIYRKVRAGDVAVGDSTLAKVIAAVSLVFWFTVLILGRFMPYVEY